MDRWPEPQPIAPGASPEEAAAIAGALEMDRRSTREPEPRRQPRQPEHDPWLRAALREGVNRDRLGAG